MRARFVRGEDPRKMMDIGQAALEKEKIRSLEWPMTDEFIENCLSKDYVFEEYEGFYILVYNVNSLRMWFAVTSRGGKILSSSTGKAAQSKELALKDVKAKIRKYLRDES